MTEPVWSVSYPSGTIRKDGVIQTDMSEYWEFLRNNGTPVELIDPPPPPPLVTSLAQMLSAFQDRRPDAYAAILQNFQCVSDDANLAALCASLGIDDAERYSIFEFAQTLGDSAGASIPLNLQPKV
jgi:hypothetical protein